MSLLLVSPQTPIWPRNSKEGKKEQTKKLREAEKKGGRKDRIKKRKNNSRKGKKGNRNERNTERKYELRKKCKNYKLLNEV